MLEVHADTNFNYHEEVRLAAETFKRVSHVKTCEPFFSLYEATCLKAIDKYYLSLIKNINVMIIIAKLLF